MGKVRGTFRCRCKDGRVRTGDLLVVECSWCCLGRDADGWWFVNPALVEEIGREGHWDEIRDRVVSINKGRFRDDRPWEERQRS